MNKILIGILASLGILAGGGAAAIVSGVIDVGADVPHLPAIHGLLEYAREQSIARRARDIAAPADLADPQRVRRGAGNYDAMCADCHLSPGADDSEIRQGLYPQPPDLAKAGNDRSAARSFWIIKHGIKSTGMPAWSKGGVEDGDIWDLVAFLQALPSLTPDQYRQQVAASPGHSHGGAAQPAAPAAGHDHHDHDHDHDHDHPHGKHPH